MRKEFRFLALLGLFLIPIIILLGLPLLALYRAGEFMNYNAIAARRASSPVVVQLAYSSPLYYLNMQAVLQKKPDVLVLGSSRVNEVRSNFFNAGTNIYNANTIIQNIPQFKEFLDQVPASTSPKVLIIGLDQKFFNPNYSASPFFGVDDITPLLKQASTPTMSILENWWSGWFSIYGYYFSGKFPIAQLIHPPSSTIGLPALVDSTGYRNDGSMNEGASLAVGQDGQFLYADLGIRGFEYSDTISQTALDQLDAFLAECKARNIYVIGYIPPFSPEMYAAITASGKYGYINSLSPEVGNVFDKYHFALYNFTDPQALGLKQDDFHDAIHTMERGSLVMFTKMAATNTTLQHYTDPAHLQQQLDATQSETDILQN